MIALQNIIIFVKLKTKIIMKKENSKEEISQVITVTNDEAKRLLKSNMDIIQGNISRIMNEKKINQSELANAIESEPNHINYILRKKNKGITIKVLGRIAKALNVQLKELVS